MAEKNVLVPLVNANEPEAKLIEIHVNDGQLVKQGDLLFSLETTKATAEIESPVSGFIYLMSVENNNYLVGDVLAVISEEKIIVRNKKFGTNLKDKKNDLRITEPARNLATRLGLDFKKLPKDRLITEDLIIELAGSNDVDLPESLIINSEKNLIVYGAGGHAKTIIDMVSEINQYEIIGLIDDHIPVGFKVMGIPVLGSFLVLNALKEKGIVYAANGVGGISDLSSREKVFEILEKFNFTIPRLIHPRAYIEKSSTMGTCVQVFANAYIGSGAKLDSYCMINTGAVISHDCVIGSHTHIAPGALLAGQIEVGERTLVGMGVKTAIGIKIGNNVRVGNGAILNADVPSSSIIPSGKVWLGVEKQ
jgi:sugar O-acyltransferase (sialic acid O-acetyltransferase NeuD family)